MKTVNINKKALGPTLAKDDNDGKQTTTDLGEHCNGGVVNGGVGAECSVGDWETSLSCDQDGCQLEVDNDKYGC